MSPGDASRHRLAPILASDGSARHRMRTEPTQRVQAASPPLDFQRHTGKGSMRKGRSPTLTCALTYPASTGPTRRNRIPSVFGCLPSRRAASCRRCPLPAAHHSPRRREMEDWMLEVRQWRDALGLTRRTQRHMLAPIRQTPFGFMRTLGFTRRRGQLTEHAGNYPWSSSCSLRQLLLLELFVWSYSSWFTRRSGDSDDGRSLTTRLMPSFIVAQPKLRRRPIRRSVRRR